MNKPELGKSLSGAVILVTGASGGVGHASCSALCSAGARVIGTDLLDAPDGADVDTWLIHDVTSADDWACVANEIGRRYGRLDALVNIAAISLVESIVNTSLDQWRKVSSVNVESVLLGLQCLIPLLREGGKCRVGGSSVVNMSSVAGLRGFPFHSAYCASKGALTLLTKAAAREFAEMKYPIRVNSIHPATVETPMADSIFERYVKMGLSVSAGSAREAAHSVHPIGRMGRPEEVANGVVFLCSSESSFMTGTELVIDGGVLA